MIAWSEDFGLGKSLILNAIYDTLEAMDLPIISADSEKGEISIKITDGRGRPQVLLMRVKEGVDKKAEITNVEAHYDGQVEETMNWAMALKDEISGTMKRINLI